jgi:hypothetical protein
VVLIDIHIDTNVDGVTIVPCLREDILGPASGGLVVVIYMEQPARLL